MRSFLPAGQEPAPPPPPPLPPGGAPPPPPGAAGVNVRVPGVTDNLLAGAPQTAQELDALRERRSELSDQLVSAASRRDELAAEIAGASGANLAGLESRLQVLDQRIVQLETDIAVTGRQVAAAPAHLLSESSEDGGAVSGGAAGRSRSSTRRPSTDSCREAERKAGATC